MAERTTPPFPTPVIAKHVGHRSVIYDATENGIVVEVTGRGNKKVAAYLEAAINAHAGDELERLAQKIVDYAPYVIATLHGGNRIKVEGKADWEMVHVGRAESSMSQLEGLLEAARRALTGTANTGGTEDGR